MCEQLPQVIVLSQQLDAAAHLTQFGARPRLHEVEAAGGGSEVYDEPAYHFSYS